ncbi:MAG: pyrroloquinoline quinone biosynthesis peptide chaperone PqqD [Candidatus Cybelea sp.]|jgi:pyrroloquinoline quinone biosynthesis protein D
MKPTALPRFGKGVKLRHDGNGSVMLLIPEGALVLNASAAAALELVDGTRPLAEIVTAVAERFDVSVDHARGDILELFARLEQRGLIAPFDCAQGDKAE